MHFSQEVCGVLHITGGIDSIGSENSVHISGVTNTPTVIVPQSETIKHPGLPDLYILGRRFLKMPVKDSCGMPMFDLFLYESG